MERNWAPGPFTFVVNFDLRLLVRIYPKSRDIHVCANNVDLGQTPQNVSSDQSLPYLPLIQLFQTHLFVVKWTYLILGQLW